MALLAVAIDALASGTVSGGRGDVERTSDRLRITLVYGASGRRWKASQVVTGTRPLGQGGGLARPAECTARQSARTVRTVSLAKAAVAHSLPGERSSVAASRLKRRVSLLRGWAGKCNR